MVTDKEIKWLRKLMFLSINGSQSFGTVQVSSTGGVTLSVLASRSFESSSSFISKISGSGSNTAGGLVSAVNDGYDWQVPIPYDLDVTKNIGISVIWTKDNSGGTHVTGSTFKVTYGVSTFIAPQVGVGGVGTGLVSPTTALDTTIAAHPVTGTDNVLLYTSPRGVISPTSAGGKGLITPSLGWWGLRAQLVTFAGQGGTDNVYILGILIDYAVRKAQGGVRPVDVGILQAYLDTSPAPAIFVA